MSDTSGPTTLGTATPEVRRGRFESAWQAWHAGEDPPRWERFLPALDEPCDPDLIFLLIRMDIEFRVKAGLSALLTERYFEHPCLRQDDTRLHTARQIELIRREYQQRWHNGERPRRGDYQAAFPQHADALRDLKPRLFCPQCRQPIDLEEMAETLHCPVCGIDPLRTVGSPPFVAELTPPGETPAARVSIPGYELLGELGRGGMGVVYKVLHLRLNRVVALKVIRDIQCASPEHLVRFLSEAEAVAHVRHPHIAQIYEVGQLNGRPYYTMEYVEGGTLARKVARNPQPPRQAAHMVEMLARAVHVAHQCGIIHRDLKPDNILLAADGTPRITDFGLAKRWQGDSGLTQTGEILGTPSYMAPEQAEGRIKDLGPLTDVYALGAILYELLTGRPPFVGVTSFDILDQVKNKEPLPFGRLRIPVPRGLETICLKCLQKDPRQRYASAEDLADDLRRFLNGRPIIARPIGLLGSAWLWCHRPERVREAGVYAVVLGIVLILWTSYGLAYLACGWSPPARPREVVLYFTGLIGLVYCPVVLIGLGTIARKVLPLWLGLGFFSFWLVIAYAMIYQHLLGFTFDWGGTFPSMEIRTPTFSLLSFIILVGVLLYAVALLAYYSNRDLMRGSRVEAGPSQALRETTETPL